ncbi:hypothetical protein AMATHDRAFT_49565 [Amanita thiersii Skay4041]|uniref:Lysine-specific metallo-endopeptidase domain-containing protein n=1 Tax=Amanita thiersii Skay4041 TaxID=703135 RepID=A0A2A9NCL7_9AGAR|nr:hypothetical protein AMATHDRAFT_49565 [Amanita thiersii Skay4041]
MYSALLTIALLVATVSSAAVNVAPSLSLEITGADTAEKVEDMIISTIITNKGEAPIVLLNAPSGVLSDLPTESFQITDEKGASPEFIGMRVKYAVDQAIESGDVTTLAPGQSATVQHDLSKAYNFASSGEGRYSIKAANEFYVVDQSTKELQMVEAEVGKEHVTFISGKLATRDEALERRATFVQCTAARQAAVNSAIREASRYAVNAYRYMQARGTASPRYTTWFGAFTTARRDTVREHFRRINNNNFNNFKYFCDCNRANVYAFVYPNQFGEIHLCPAFWNAPLTGTDSKVINYTAISLRMVDNEILSQAGTIIHESSHFTANGGTRDYVYGQANCRSLARTNPDRAVMNADSHEYFAENNPPLA